MERRFTLGEVRARLTCLATDQADGLTRWPAEVLLRLLALLPIVQAVGRRRAVTGVLVAHAVRVVTLEALRASPFFTLPLRGHRHVDITGRRIFEGEVYGICSLIHRRASTAGPCRAIKVLTLERPVNACVGFTSGSPGDHLGKKASHLVEVG